MAFRAILGVFWFPIGYLVRFYFITLLEPTLNPIKLPLSTLAFKLMVVAIPSYGAFFVGISAQQDLTAQLGPHTGPVLAFVIVWMLVMPTLYLLPGVFAFLFWEMTENWRLFRANRSAELKPVVVGRHGETILQLLRPGFHSGTIPRLFSHLRQAERDAYQSGSWRAARTYRQGLQETARLVQLFIEREFITLLHQSKNWPDQPLRVEQLVLSCNRIRVELAHARYPSETLALALEERSGWLIAGLDQPGWLRHLTPEQAQALKTALTGLYKLAGVDFVREQIDASLTPALPSYDITDHKLVAWRDLRSSSVFSYDLQDKHEEIRPRSSNGRAGPGAPTLEARRLFFSRIPIRWDQWVESWRREHAGQKEKPLVTDSMVLWPPDPASETAGQSAAPPA
jgi:hypothetical protein